MHQRLRRVDPRFGLVLPQHALKEGFLVGSIDQSVIAVLVQTGFVDFRL